MKIRDVSTLLGAAALGMALTLGVIWDVAAEPRVKWKLVSSFKTGLDVFGPNGPRLVENIRRMSDGKFEIKFFEPGTLVPPLEAFDAVSKGTVDAAYTTAGFHTSKIPALAFFSSVPFGPDPAEYLAWLQYGGGNEIYRELYAEHNVVGFHCAIIVPEASGWFKKEIKSVDDLKGLKMRIFGLGGKVMQKMGASTTVIIAGASTKKALESGAIDAIEIAFPSVDIKFGFYQIAKHYYFPGWHQQSSLLEVIVNKDRYEALPDSYKAMIEIACGEAMMHTMALGASKQAKALAELKDKGVNIHRWSPEMLAEFEAAWNEVIAEEIAKDPVFKRVYDSYSTFREEYAIWKDLGYLK